MKSSIVATREAQNGADADPRGTVATQTPITVANSQHFEPEAAREQITLRPPAQWSLGLCLGFRFCFVYFTLYSLSDQILGGLVNVNIAKFDLPDFGTVWPLRHITFWTAAHLFRVTHPLVYTGSGSGDKVFDWVQTFCLLTFAVVITAVWSALDRQRPNYITLHKWFRLFLRFALGSEMLLYGLVKIIPLQMPFPFLTRLMEPYGNFSPMATLWSSVGASPAYEIFAGCAETLGGVLVMIPRTATLGALVCLVDLTQVFVLNMTYDVPVKLFSFHLMLFALFLLAPEARRLLNFFFFSERPVAASAQPPLCRTQRANRIAVALQALFGAYLVGMNVYGGVQDWRTYGGGRPKPSLYGIWNVEQMSIDGQVRSPLLTDYDRWRRVIFDSFAGTRTSFQRMDESFTSFDCSISDKDKTLTLTKSGDKNWKARFTFDRRAPDQLILDGAMDGHTVHMELNLFDRSKLTLVNRGFHWISDYPFQR